MNIQHLRVYTIDEIKTLPPTFTGLVGQKIKDVGVAWDRPATVAWVLDRQKLHSSPNQIVMMDLPDPIQPATPIEDETWLDELAYKIATQDNRITDCPMFIVQERIVIWNIDPNQVDPDVSEYYHPDDFEVQVDKDFPGARAAHGVYHWKFVQGFFTEDGANDYIRIDGHNHGKLRVFALGTFRNNEFRRVRNLILSRNVLKDAGDLKGDAAILINEAMKTGTTITNKDTEDTAKRITTRR